MKKKLFFFIIIFNSLALLGLMLTQVYWVGHAYQLHREQFNNTVKIAMKGVVNQMLNYHMNYHSHNDSLNTAGLEEALFDASQINPGLLNFKIEEEFNCMNVGNGYEYAIIDLRDDSIVSGNVKNHLEEVMVSKHRINLTGFKDSEFMVLSVYIPQEKGLILNRIVTWLILSILFSLSIIVAFFYTISFVLRQKRLSEVKADFINNMTHEFKTPLATISLASEMLMKKSIQDDSFRLHRYAQIIYDENSRLQNHVEQILRVSLLEKGQFKLRKKETDIHELVKKIVETFEITVKERHGELKSHFCAKNFLVMADPVHLTNAITNLLDNANKYSTDAPEIKIGTYNDSNGIVISVEDSGIGIAQENQLHVFKNLYRVPTGNIYNRDKGFGIGLYYVKTIVEAHGGHIKLKSELGKGSRFDIYLPYLSKSSDDYEESQKTQHPAR